MGFRFRKRVKMAPGIYLNLTGKGISSVSVGTRGATVNVARGRPTTATVSIPGSGLSYRHTFGAKGVVREPARTAALGAETHWQPPASMGDVIPTPQATAVRQVASWSNPRFANDAAGLIAAYRGIEDAQSEVAVSRDALETAQRRLQRASAWYRRLIAPAAYRDAQDALEACRQRYEQACREERSSAPKLDASVPSAMAAPMADLRRVMKVAAGRMGRLVVECAQVNPDEPLRTLPRRVHVRWSSCIPMPLGPDCSTGRDDCVIGLRADNGDAIYFFPSYILAFVAGEVGFVAWQDFDFSFEDLMEVGQGCVAADAPPHTFTWRHVRKDGNPDFRYKDNPRLPLVPFQRHIFAINRGPAMHIDYHPGYPDVFDFGKGLLGVRDWHEAQQDLHLLSAIPTLPVTWQQRSSDGIAYLVASNGSEEVFGFGVRPDSTQLWMSIMAKPFRATFVEPGFLCSGPRCEAWLDDFQLSPGRGQGYSAHVSAEQAAFRLWPAEDEGREAPWERLATASVLAVQVSQDRGSPIRFRLDLAAVRAQLRETLRLSS